VPQTLRQLPWLLRRTLVASIDDGLFAIAKGAAYSGLLSLFPVLTSAAAVSIQIRADYVRQKIAVFLAQVLPPGTEDAVLQQFRYSGQRPIGLIVVAALLSLWAASSVIKSLVDGFNAAYRIPRNRSMLSHIGVGILLVFLALVPMFGASSLILFGGAAERGVLKLWKVDPVLNPLTGSLEFLFRALRYVIAFSAAWALTAILYYFGPYRKQRWRDVWAGAFLATVLWLLATLGFSWYVRHITNYNVLYGSIGTGIALLIWMYLLAIIALFGCEFNAERERIRIAEASPIR
jgi:membrane protein